MPKWLHSQREDLRKLWWTRRAELSSLSELRVALKTCGYPGLSFITSDKKKDAGCDTTQPHLRPPVSQEVCTPLTGGGLHSELGQFGVEDVWDDGVKCWAEFHKQDPCIRPQQWSEGVLAPHPAPNTPWAVKWESFTCQPNPLQNVFPCVLYFFVEIIIRLWMSLKTTYSHL